MTVEPGPVLAPLTDTDLAMRVLAAAADPEVQNLVWWRREGGPIAWFVDCTDLFTLGVEDCQPITEDTVHAFERAIADVRDVTGGDATYGPALYVARQRGARPVGGSYPTDDRLWLMFDACGPEHQDSRGTDLTAAEAAPPDRPAYRLEPVAEPPTLLEGQACCPPAPAPAAGAPDHCGLCGTPFPAAGTEQPA